jgi:hypothetical protein
MSPIGVILEDGDQSEMGAGNGLQAHKAASSSKCSASPDLRAEAATQGPSDIRQSSLFPFTLRLRLRLICFESVLLRVLSVASSRYCRSACISYRLSFSPFARSFWLSDQQPCPPALGIASTPFLTDP